jgi:hypothetical protein
VKPPADPGADPTTVLVEHYWPGITAERFEIAAGRVRSSADALAEAGVRIRFLHSTLVPEDEAAFCVFEAESHAVVREAYARAGVPYERMLGALEIGVGATGITSIRKKEKR